MLTFNTDKPRSLLAAIKKAIDEGHVKTWEYDSDGDFTHTTSSQQWTGKAWLRPIIEPDQALAFGILGQRGVKTSKLLYGVYHGRFIEMMLTHFDTQFSNAQASAACIPSVDQITS